MKYPTYIKNCIEILEESGYSAYAVGGAVRDSLLGREPSDWDVTTSARPDEILSVFAAFRTIPTGIKHGTITVLFESDDGNGERVPVEITTYRIDGEYRDSRHPESVEFSTELENDLSRRDFTVNAMAFNEKEGIVDIFGGIKDLEKRTIRAVGEPQKRFSEDALRILRALRFSAQLGFEIEKKTLLAASECAHLLKNIARERVGVEFKKLISCPGVTYSLRKMIEGGIWQSIFDLPCPSEKTVIDISSLPSGNFATRLAAITVGYPDEQRDLFLNSLRLSNDEKRLVLRLCRVKDFEILKSESNFSALARRFLHLYDNIFDDAKQMLVYFRIDDTGDFLATLGEERKKQNPLSISDLAIKGSDLLPLCKSDFSKVGKTLEYLLELVLENPALNRNYWQLFQYQSDDFHIFS